MVGRIIGESAARAIVVAVPRLAPRCTVVGCETGIMARPVQSGQARRAHPLTGRAAQITVVPGGTTTVVPLGGVGLLLERLKQPPTSRRGREGSRIMPTALKIDVHPISICD